jgi:hypothetical protein
MKIYRVVRSRRFRFFMTFGSTSHYDRQSLGQSRLGIRSPSGTCNQFFFLLEILFRQLRVCYFVAPSLTRGQVCNLLLLLILASAVPLSCQPYASAALYPLPNDFQLLISVRGSVNPRAIARLEGLGKLKKIHSASNILFYMASAK